MSILFHLPPTFPLTQIMVTTGIDGNQHISMRQPFEMPPDPPRRKRKAKSKTKPKAKRGGSPRRYGR